MPRYHFVVGVTLGALDVEVNRITADRAVTLNQVLYAHGTGFVGVLEYPERSDDARDEPRREPSKSKPAASPHRKKP